MARSVFVSFLLEIHFDTATIFIYAFSPLQITVQAHGLLVLLSIIGIAVLIVIAAKFLPRRGMSALQRTYRNVSQWSIGVKVFLLISAFVFLLLAPSLSSSRLLLDKRWRCGGAKANMPFHCSSRSRDHKRRQTSRPGVRAMCNVAISRRSS